MKLRALRLALVLALMLVPQIGRPEIPKDKGYSVREIRDGLYWLTDYKGINHELSNIFIYAPRQKVLMLVDVQLATRQ